MSASFRVHRSFVLQERGLFVLSGEITEGMVQIGMSAVLPGLEDAFSARVHGVELLEGEPALTFSWSKAEKLARWQAIDWSGRELQLGW